MDESKNGFRKNDLKNRYPMLIILIQIVTLNWYEPLVPANNYFFVVVYTIPSKSNTKDPWDCDGWLYEERYLMECFFDKTKHFRRVAMRYDKLASSFYTFVYIFAILTFIKMTSISIFQTKLNLPYFD